MYVILSLMFEGFLLSDYTLTKLLEGHLLAEGGTAAQHFISEYVIQ